MAADGHQIRGKIAALQAVFNRGMYAVVDGLLASNVPLETAEFRLVTGGNGLVDIPATPGAYVLFPAADVPKGLAFDITSLALYVTGATAWSGGTGTTVSVSIQGTDGTVIATFTQNALTGSASPASPTTYSIGAGSTLATGVSDNSIRALVPSLPAGVGLQVVVSNSNAGSPVRLRISGYLVPA